MVLDVVVLDAWRRMIPEVLDGVRGAGWCWRFQT